MKKIIFSLLLLSVSSVSYAGTYKCKAYLDGVVVGEPIQVSATKDAIAETKAANRIRKREGKDDKYGKVDYVRCNKI